MSQHDTRAFRLVNGVIRVDYGQPETREAPEHDDTPLRRECRDCGRIDGHHPNCPNNNDGGEA